MSLEEVFKSCDAIPVELTDAKSKFQSLRETYYYSAPELKPRFWIKFYNEFVIPYLVPHNGEAWTKGIKAVWKTQIQLANKKN